MTKELTQGEGGVVPSLRDKNELVAIKCRDLAIKMATKKGLSDEKRSWLKLALYGCQVTNSIQNSTTNEKLKVQMEAVQIAIGKNI